MFPLRDIRQGERKAAVAAFLSIGGIIAAHELLETARDALFLASIPASRLPWLYLGLAFAGLAIASGPLGRVWEHATAPERSLWCSLGRPQ